MFINHQLHIGSLLITKIESIGMGAQKFLQSVEGNKLVAIDVPFRTLSLRYYYNMSRLLAHSGVTFQKTDHSATFSKIGERPFISWFNLVIGSFTLPLFSCM